MKKALADAAERYFAEARARREELAQKPAQIGEILADGASRCARRRQKFCCGAVRVA